MEQQSKTACIHEFVRVPNSVECSPWNGHMPNAKKFAVHECRSCGVWMSLPVWELSEEAKKEMEKINRAIVRV